MVSGEEGAVGDWREPEYGDDIPGGFGEGFEEVSEEGGAVAAGVMAGSVDLLEVEGFGEAAIPDLQEEGFGEVEEFVAGVVCCCVCFFA